MSYKEENDQRVRKMQSFILNTLHNWEKENEKGAPTIWLWHSTNNEFYWIPRRLFLEALDELNRTGEIISKIDDDKERWATYESQYEGMRA